MYMNIYIDGVTIPYKKAVKVYKDKSTCKRLFGLNSQQYDLLLKIIARTQPSASGSRFPVHSYERAHPQYSSLSEFQTILPESYTPVSSSRQLAQQFDDTERHVQQQMPMHTEWMGDTVNKGLFDRRFFTGAGAGTGDPVPLRFTTPDSSTAPSMPASMPATASQGAIFSRTFDLTMKHMPDVSFERQTKNTRFS